eukprot:tig00000144_g9096.t1
MPYVEPLLVAAQTGPDSINDILGFSTNKLQILLHAIVKLLMEQKDKLVHLEDKLSQKANAVDVIDELGLMKRQLALLEKLGVGAGEPAASTADLFGLKAAEEVLARVEALERAAEARFAKNEDELLVLTGRVAKLEADRVLWEEEAAQQAAKLQRGLEEVREVRRDLARKADHSEVAAVDAKVGKIEEGVAALEQGVLQLKRSVEGRLFEVEREGRRAAEQVGEVYTAFKVVEAAAEDHGRQLGELYLVKADVNALAGKAEAGWVEEALGRLRQELNAHLFGWGDDVARLRATLEKLGLMMSLQPAPDCGPECHVPPIAGRMHFRCISCDQVVNASIPPAGLPTPSKVFNARDALREALGGREVPLVGKGAVYRGRHYLEGASPAAPPPGAPGPGEDPFPPSPDPSSPYAPSSRPITSTAASPGRLRMPPVQPGGSPPTLPRKPNTAPLSAR